jgi:hypothetical protein
VTAPPDPMCAELDAVVVELVVGRVDEPRRSELLAHAARCGRCDLLLRDVIAVSDRLLASAPQAEPPTGFETRVVESMGHRERRGRGRRGPRAAVTVAVAAGALVVAGIGFLLGRGSDPEPVVVAAPVVDDGGDPVGTMELWTAGAPHLVLEMDGPSTWPGTWSCELLDDGRWVEVGTWTADDVVDHTWAVAVDGSVLDATEMRIRGGDGTVIASASLPDVD